jgi:phospholipid/cholesterol/gamma-HCH transport system substrate-binding protein
MAFFRNLITLPGRFVRGAWRFVNPKLKVGRIPYARTTLVIQFIAALIFLGYTLTKKDTQLPFSEEPYEVQVMLDDAQGLNPTKEPAAGVAGVNNGKVTEAVVADNGQALVTLSFNEDIEGKIFADATAFVRPTSALQTLIVNVDPGSPEAGPLPEGEVISAANSKSSVSIDDLTGLLNADTQAQTQVLISEAAIALKDREPELRRILAELGELTDSATPIAEALADRRRLLVKLTDSMDLLFTTLGQRGAQLANAIDAGSDTLAVTAGREAELAEATRARAPTLDETTRALSSTRTLAESLVPALDEILPVADQVAPASEKFRELLPKLDELVEASDQLIEDGAKPVRLFSNGMKGLADRVRGDQVPALRELVDLVELLFDYRYGLLQFAENISGVASQNRNAGPFAQFAIVNAEFKPEWLGFPPAAARSKNGQPSVLDTAFAAALEKTCRQNAAACVLRFSMPGLPEKPVLDKFLEGRN